MGADRSRDDARTVAVVVPTVSQAAHLDACLASLRHHHAADDIALDIVVVLNGALPAVRDVARHARHVRVVESPVNRGFAGGCQIGVRATEAAWLVFLNDDVRVTSGWLVPLLETMRERPRAGAVAPRVLGTDGLVQEVGSIIWRDGTTRPFGRGLPASALAWRWRRRVDYASACAILVRREAWERVGGFDEGYHPAYYEDVDFCLALDAAGYEVWVDPRADVVHAESASTGSAFKQYLFARHHARLVSRWGARLVDRVAAPLDTGALASAEQAAAARLGPTGPRVVVVDDRLPRHGLGSGFDRMADALIELSGSGASVQCVATEVAPEFSPPLARAGVAVLEGDADAALRRHLPEADLVIVSRPNNAVRVRRVIAEVPPAHRPQVVYDAEALYHRRLERQAELQPGPAGEALRRQGGEWREAEAAIARHADAVVCVSSEEAAFFRDEGARDVRVAIPWLRQASLTEPTLAGRADIGFVAGWLAGAGSPNGDGLSWFVAEVLPRIVDEVPWVRLRVTGTLPPELRHLIGVHVREEGFVDDLAVFYRRLRVAVAPLRFGAGVKLKTLEALQYGVPVVTTAIGAEGLDTLPPGTLAVHDAPDAFAAAVVERLLDVRTWRAHRTAIDGLVSGLRVDGTWAALVAAFSKEGAGVGHAL